MLNLTIAASTVALALSLSACSSSTDSSGKVHEARTKSQGGAMQDRGSEFGATPTNLATTTKALLTAAEPFEALTETAFTASKSQRSKAIEADADAVRSVQGIVPQSVLIVLKRNMAAISAADVADHPADIALASIENYRALVSAVPGNPAVPVDVSLLDYSGFRFDADAQATPVRWDDMSRTVAFARQRWSSVRQHGAAAKIAPRFQAALNAMEQAAREKNAAHARLAAKVELDLVDKLEAAFEHPGRPKT